MDDWQQKIRQDAVRFCLWDDIANGKVDPQAALSSPERQHWLEKEQIDILNKLAALRQEYFRSHP